ncbi:MAG: STAS domain-containing protein [Planctomycetota bacterium]|nr:STAS domain-containing protein [Planctomycetota bacterium]
MAEADSPSFSAIRLQYTPDRQLAVLTFLQADLRSPLLIRRLEEELLQAAKILKSRRLVVDFAGVTVAPTAILGLVLQLVVDAREREIRVRVCNLAPVIRKAFDLLNAKGLVPVYENRKAAMTDDWEKSDKKKWWFF